MDKEFTYRYSNLLTESEIESLRKGAKAASKAHDHYYKEKKKKEEKCQFEKRNKQLS